MAGLSRRGFLGWAGGVAAGLLALRPGHPNPHKPKPTTTTAPTTTTVLPTTTEGPVPTFTTTPTTVVVPGPFVYDVLVLVSDSNATAQSKIDGAAANAVVGFEAGVHYERKVTGRLGQTYRGDPRGTTVFDGSRLVTGWTGSNPWVASHTITDRGTTPDLTGVATALADVGAQYPEELFFVTPNQNTGWSRKRREGQPSTSTPPAGAWTISYSAGTLRVAEDPTSTQVRVSVTDRAIVPPTFGAGGLTIEDIHFHLYASETRASAWGLNTDHRDWTFRRVCTEDCHGTAAAIGPGDTIRNSRFGFAGQIGPYAATLASGYSAGWSMYDSEVVHNGLAPYNWDWEGGGSKLDSGSGAQGAVTIRNTWWHHNRGPSLWFDENASETAQVTIESNLIEDGEIMGIFWEVSANPVLIRWNTIRRCGVGSVPHVGGSVVNDDSGNGIDISNSSPASGQLLVTANKVDGCLTGILLQDEDRSPFLGSVNLDGNHVAYRRDISGGNLVKFRWNTTSTARIDSCGADNNRYFDTSAAARWFMYGPNGGLQFTDWQAQRTGSGLTGALDPNGLAGITGTMTDPATFVPFTTSHYGPGA